MTPRPPPDTADELGRLRTEPPREPATMPFAGTLRPISRPHVQRTLVIWLLLVSAFLLVWYFLEPGAPLQN